LTTNTPRTLLEQLIRAGDRTLHEWSDLFNALAPPGANASMSPRQLQRWMAGQVRTARPASRRVAEQLWGHPFSILLGH
jgi:hypothetical protein